MKILHIHPSLKIGGIEAMICGLANQLVKEEEVTVCSIFEPESSDVFYDRLSPEVRRISCHKKKPGFSLKELFVIYWIFRKGKYDIVHIHGFLYYYMLAILLMWHSKTRFVYTVHNDAARENGVWDSKFLFLKKWLFRSGRVCPVTISEISKDSFTAFYHCDSQLIYNGTPCPQIDVTKHTDVIVRARRSEHTLVVLNAARVDVQKNQTVFCKVMQRLIAEGVDIVALIAGSVTNAASYEEIKPYFSDRIIYLGERNDIPQLFSECDAFCLPSIWEGLPVSLLESLAVGCIPICAPVGGVVNVVTDGYDGILSASSSEEDYYQAMKRFLSMRAAERISMKQQGMETFKRFDISSAARAYMAYYRQIITC